MIETGAAAGLAGKAAGVAGLISSKNLAAAGVMPFFVMTAGGTVKFNVTRFLEVFPLLVATLGALGTMASLYADFQIMKAELLALKAEIHDMRADIYAPRFDPMGPQRPK